MKNVFFNVFLMISGHIFLWQATEVGLSVTLDMAVRTQ